MSELSPDTLSAGRAVLAASTGGHLAQLVRLRHELPIADKPLWITFDHPQSRALLAQERVVFVPYIESRGYLALLRAAVPVWRALRAERAEVAYSTGSALALAVLPLARLRRMQAIYIESVSRFDGPSMSGRILAKLRGVRVFTQHARWATKRWRPGPSLMAAYSVTQSPEPVNRPLRIFVTLGTIKPYRFDRLISHLEQALPADAEVRVQFGETTMSHPTWDAQAYTSSEEFDDSVRWADTVVSHAGVGSALRIMDLGKAPLLAVRRARFGEHVDDHQEQIARYLSEEGLGREVEADCITAADLEWAARARISVPTPA